MSQEHAATLLNLTGDLLPAGATTAVQLTELRQLLLVALRAGETPADIGLRQFAGAPVNGAEAEIAALGDAAPLPTSRNRFARRSAAILAADQVTGGPQWTLAQTPAVTRGPFQDGGGLLHWFDIYTPEPTFSIVPQGAPGPIALLPPETVRPAGTQTLTIPAGNLWLAGPSIHASAPAGSWAGLRITGGTATLSGPVSVTAAGAVLRELVGQKGGATLHVTLDTRGLAGFPATVTIGASANGITIFNLVPGSLTAFGNTIAMNPPNVLPTVSGYDPVLRSMLIPMTPDAGMFTATPGADGGLFPMSGSAAIESAAWIIPVTVVAGGAFADLEGPGSLAVTVGTGLVGT